MRCSTTYSALGVSALFLSCIVLYFFHDLSYSELRKNFTLGTDGVEMVSAGEDLHPKFLPWEPLEKNFGLNDMLKQLCIESGKKDSCYTDKEARFRIVTQEHHITATDGTSYVLERNTTPLSRKLVWWSVTEGWSEWWDDTAIEAHPARPYAST